MPTAPVSAAYRPFPTAWASALAIVVCASSAAAEKIVFTTDRDLNLEIYTMEADGSNQTNVSNSPGSTEYRPTFSPGGGQIAFVTTRDGDPEIYVMNADGTGQTNLTNDPGTDLWPCWSPDGTKIIFDSDRAGNTDIYVMDADGSNVVQLTTDINQDQHATWSPDGTKIAWHTYRDANWEIYVMDADGSNKTNITNHPDIDQYPAWSPDGTQIAFSTLRNGDVDFEICTMNADGTNQLVITANLIHEVSPWWSPDGTRILFCTNATSNNEVYTIDPDGTNLTDLSNTPGGDVDARWSWGSPANYRSIGTNGGVLHSAGTVSVSGTTATFSGTTLPAGVGVGDELVATGGITTTIVREQSVTGGANSTPLTLPSIAGGTDQFYALFAATRNNDDVTGVTGGGLIWTEQYAQCGDGSETGLSIYTASGSPASFAAQVSYTKSPGNSPIAVTLTRYSGVGSFEDIHGENINGENGNCNNASDNSTARITLSSTTDGSVHVAGIAPRGESVDSFSSGYSLAVSHVQGGGSNQTSTFVYDGPFNPAATDLFTATLSGSVDWAAVGIVLNPVFGADVLTYHVRSRDSDTAVTVHNVAEFTQTNATYTIKRAYNTLQDWEDSRQGDLVAAGRREVGVCYNDGEFIDRLVISGSTTDDSSYMHLTVAEGQRHTGLQDTGARIDPAGAGWGAQDAITVEDEYTRIEWLEITDVQDYADAISFSNSPPADNGLVANVFVHGFWQGSGNAAVNIAANGITVRNCFATGGTQRAISMSGGSATIENCTFWGSPGSGNGIQIPAGDVSITNTISVGHDSGLDVYIETAGAATISAFGTNMFTSHGGGFDPDGYEGGNVSPPTDLEDLFVSLSGTIDLHILPIGHTALDAGADLSSRFTDDIDGESRGAWDIGADEAGVNYRSIGTGGVLYTGGKATINAGSSVVTFSQGASLPTYVGAGDELVIGADTYYLTARNSATQASVHVASTTTHTADLYTIQRAYSGFQAWETAREGDLVGENRIEVGVAYHDGDFVPGSTIEIDGSTTDATHFMRITVAEGQRHSGIAGNGTCVLVDGASAGGDVLRIMDEYTVVEWLTITDFNGAFSDGIVVEDSPSAANALLQNLIIYDFLGGFNGIRIQEDTTVRNTILYGGGGVGIRVESGASATIENVTINDMTNEGVIGSVTAGSIAVRNSIAVDCLTGVVIDCPVTYFGYNMYSTHGGSFDPASHEGNNKSPPADLDDLFISIVPGIEDLHLEPAGHLAGNRGVDLSSDFLGDIDGVTRTESWDIGADEGVSGTLGTSPRLISWQEIEPQ